MSFCLFIFIAYNIVQITDPTLPSTTYLLKDILPYTTYDCRVRAGNVQNGSTLWSNFSAVLTFTTGVAGKLLIDSATLISAFTIDWLLFCTFLVPSASPSEVYVTSIASQSFNLKWEVRHFCMFTLLF